MHFNAAMWEFACHPLDSASEAVSLPERVQQELESLPRPSLYAMVCNPTRISPRDMFVLIESHGICYGADFVLLWLPCAMTMIDYEWKPCSSTEIDRHS